MCMMIRASGTTHARTQDSLQKKIIKRRSDDRV